VAQRTRTGTAAAAPDQSPEWIEFSLGDEWDPTSEIFPLLEMIGEVIPDFGDRLLLLREIQALYAQFNMKKCVVRDDRFGVPALLFPAAVWEKLEAVMRMEPRECPNFVTVRADISGLPLRWIMLHELAHVLLGVPSGILHERYRQEDVICDAIAAFGAYGPRQREPGRIIAELGHWWGPEPAGVAECEFRIRTACEVAERVASHSLCMQGAA
jgi:hypothetical protein